jgi:hypothetical protein
MAYRSMGADVGIENLSINKRINNILHDILFICKLKNEHPRLGGA